MRLSIIICCAALFALVSGCNSIPKRQVYTAKYSKEKINIDGRQNKKAWEKAENLTFQSLDGSFCTENGIAKSFGMINMFTVRNKTFGRECASVRVPFPLAIFLTNYIKSVTKKRIIKKNITTSGNGKTRTSSGGDY